MRKIYFGLFLGLCAGLNAQVKTWTTTNDFNEGTYFNTNSSTVPGELRLNKFGTAPVPFINVPAGGRVVADRGWPYTPGRVVRINTETGQVVGEYRTTPNSLEAAPSRCVVDSFGNAWVTNRYEGAGTYAVTKIAVLIGGTRYYQPVKGIYLPHPLGEYVKDPVFTTAVDRDGDGYIRTSVGLGNLLDWDATSGKDLDSSVASEAPGTVQEANDELITVFKRYRGSGGKSRSIAIDGRNHIWIGFHDSQYGILELDPDDGHILQTLITPLPGYTMLYQDGELWTTAIDTVDNRPYRINSTTGNAVLVTGDGAYSVASFAPLANGDVLASCGTGSGHNPPEFLILDKTTATVKKRIGVPGGGDLRGIMQDQDGDIWLASRGLWAAGPYRVYRYKQDGTLVREFYTGDRPCGLGLDANGLVWVTHIGDPGNQANGNWTTVIDPHADENRGAVVGYVGIGTGSYNYSDGTGATTSQVSRSGEWRAVYDSFRPNVIWGTMNWDAVTPSGAHAQFYARAGNTRSALNNAVWYEFLSNGSDSAGALAGRYLEVRVRLTRDEGTSSDLTPQVRSLTVRFAKGTISGNVGLGNWLPLDYPTADFILRPVAGGSDVNINAVQLGPFGAFAFKTPLRGNYWLLAKSSHWLRQRLTVSLNITDNGNPGQVFALLNGDGDDDNSITVFDYGMLSDAFDTVPGDPDWNPSADFDGDDSVNVFDYSILSDNFDLSGDF